MVVVVVDLAATCCSESPRNDGLIRAVVVVSFVVAYTDKLAGVWDVPATTARVDPPKRGMTTKG